MTLVQDEQMAIGHYYNGTTGQCTKHEAPGVPP